MVAGSRQRGKSRQVFWLDGAALGLTVGLFILLGGAQRALQGQPLTDQTRRARILEEPFRLMMDEQVPAGKRALFDWGGWYRSTYWGVDEGADRDFNGSEDRYRAFWEQEFRLWGYLNLDGVHQFYARMKLDGIDWKDNTSYDYDDHDLAGPQLERGWYDFRLSRAQGAYGWTPGDVDLSVRIGRQYVELGTGLALSVPLDALVLTGYYDDWELTALGALSIPSTANVDRSVPDDTKENRCYWGLQVNYTGWPEHQPFAYFYAQEDKDGGVERLGQTFGYDSRYAGVGSRGRFFARDLQYSCEVVGEFGKSYAWATGEAQRQVVQAWAFDSELRYVMPDAHLSELALGYIWASGDPDRQYSPTNTVGGNRPHSTDTSFVGWGFRNTGILLAPRLSNLGTVWLEASTYPLNQYPAWEKLRVGADFYVYHKQRSGGAMSDGDSLARHHYVGSEIDLYADWRITSDLAWTLRYGMFWPGAALGDAVAPARDIDRSFGQLFFTGLTLNF